MAGSALSHEWLWATGKRLLAGTENLETTHDDDGGHSEFGVHIEYEDLYNAIIFFACIYVAGQVFSRFLKMPSLVGEIVCGILLGPPLADFVPNASAWVLLGEIGLVLLVVEAGIDIDLATLKLIGTRGFLIAFFGSIFPIGIGMLIGYIIDVGDTKAIIATGATFGPTSLGIALNILRSGGILNTPVGQLIVSAAVIDDMIALVVLSQLEALVGEITVQGVLIPVISALAFLILGGYIAIFVFPGVFNKYVLGRFDEEMHDKLELATMLGLLLALMPATYYGQASYLMGGFISGLAFCTSHGLHVLFVRQFKRILQWLMRIFFAASIGFQVPIKDFGDGTVIWQGLVFTLALLGKLLVGFMVPNFTQSRKYTNFHLRDCLITGFSMAAEGEFAFVIAVFAVDQGLIDKDVYASVVLAVLLSTIIPPFLLRFTISYYNKKAEEVVDQIAEEEAGRKHDLDTMKQTSVSGLALVEGIKDNTAVFLCIQTQSESSWGLMHRIMQTMAKQGLDVIDHRAWAPRGINTTLVNEVYARGQLKVEEGKKASDLLDGYIDRIKEALLKAINQEDAKVNVQRWYPGVVQEIVEEVDEKHNRNIHKRLLAEASQNLERKQRLQTMATQEKTVADILGEMEQGGVAKPTVDQPEAPLEGIPIPKTRPRRRVRQKMRSTPVVGGGLFGEEEKHEDRHDFFQAPQGSGGIKKPDFDIFSTAPKSSMPAELMVNGETYHIRVSKDTLKDLQRGFAGQMVDNRGIEISGINIEATDNAPVVQRLQGYVRNMPLSQIQEETFDEASELSSQLSDHKDNHKES